MKYFYRVQLLALMVLVTLLPACAPTPIVEILAAPDTTPPLIKVWYGDHQVFGRQGLPQTWVNILGNISDPESHIRSASYTLNGGQPVSLRLGPDERRLEKPGDFNIELDSGRLLEAINQVKITAVNRDGLQTVAAVTVEFRRGTWPLPYQVDWSKVTLAQLAVQIVDGRWAWDSNGIRPVELGYDRVLDIGGMSWTNYEVTVPFTLHGIAPDAYQVKGSPGAGFGIGMHWLGHSDDPVKCDWPSQPHCGWQPTGGTGWYSFKKSGVDTLDIEAGQADLPITIHSLKLAFDHTYLFKMRVVDQPGGNSYFLKVWEPGVENEPAAWTLQRTFSAGPDGQKNLDHGSFLIVLHRVDATIGNITVNPIEMP